MSGHRHTLIHFILSEACLAAFMTFYALNRWAKIRFGSGCYLCVNLGCRCVSVRETCTSWIQLLCRPGNEANNPRLHLTCWRGAIQLGLEIKNHLGRPSKTGVWWNVYARAQGVDWIFQCWSFDSDQTARVPLWWSLLKFGLGNLCSA